MFGILTHADLAHATQEMQEEEHQRPKNNERDDFGDGDKVTCLVGGEFEQPLLLSFLGWKSFAYNLPESICLSLQRLRACLSLQRLRARCCGMM